MPNSMTKILYFHSGGLMTGHKDDYPQKYIKQFEALGYQFIGFNYPLAPQETLDEIILACVNFIKEHNQSDTILFGRSAGAYLALQSLQELALSNEKLPTKLILFYGYENFNVNEFYQPKKYPIKIQKHQIEQFIDQKTNSDPLYHRSLLYLYGRQEGIWPELITDNSSYKTREIDDFKIDTFIAHSSHDQDVPYRESKKLNRKLSGSTLITLYYLDHEFDLHQDDPQTIELMNQLFEWLKK